nr:hypothetical protein [Actinomycetota bacterium]
MRLKPSVLAISVAMAALFAGFGSVAHAKLTAVGRAGESTGVALGGERVLWTAQKRRVLAVRSAPLAGGASVEVFRHRARDPLIIGDNELLAASPQRAALRAVSIRSKPRRGLEEVFVGSPSGPFSRLGLPASELSSTQLEVGDQVVAVTGLNRADQRLVVIYEPGLPPLSRRLPESAKPAIVAGDLIAYDVQHDGPTLTSEIVVRDRRTWALRSTLPVADYEPDYDLAPDGTVVVVNKQGGLTLVSPFGVGRQLPRPRIPMSEPRFAGSMITVKRGNGVGPEHVGIVSPMSGQARRLGPDTFEVGAMATSDRGVTWEANGCVLAATLSDPGAASVPAGPCPRAEAEMTLEQTQKLRGRVLRIPVDCISSPTRACHGELRVHEGHRVIGRGRFAIPVRGRRKVSVRLKRAPGRRLTRFVRTLGRLNETSVDVTTITVDPQGRKSTSKGPFYLARP